MYCVDSLKRLNEEAVAAATYEESRCDYCDKPATAHIPIYNPADALRDPPVEGAYCVVHVCEACDENGYLYEENFCCPDCGEWFIINHSWDVVAVMTDDGYFCQKCYAENYLHGRVLFSLLRDLREGNTDKWPRINSVPGKDKIFEGEFSTYSDFPGYNRWSDLANAIEAAAHENGLKSSDTVYPIIDHGYQFSVSLSVYA